MKRAKIKIKQSGITLVEMLVVVAIIAILAAITVGIATHISNQSKNQLTKNTFALLNAALSQFRDYEYNYNYKAPPNILPEKALAILNFYRSLDFPIDCNILTKPLLEIELGSALGTRSILITPPVHDPNYSGSEALYFFLSRVPTSRQTLDKIDDSLITNLNSNKQPMKIIINGRTHSLLRIIDPWGTTLRYDYYNELMLDPILRDKGKRNFPVIISAGPDRIFGTGDDITNR